MAIKKKLNDWLIVEANKSHPYYPTLKTFADADYDRKNFDIKNLRQLIIGGIIGSTKPWEVCVGKIIGQLIAKPIPTNYPTGSIYDFLGIKILNNIIGSSETKQDS